MANEVYADLEILASMGDEYLVRIGKDALNALVVFDEHLVVRHWDGEKPVILEPYGDDAIRTAGDESASNNLAELPEVGGQEVIMLRDLCKERS